MSSQDSNNSDCSIQAKLSQAQALQTKLNALSAEQKTRRKNSASFEEKASAVRLKLCHLLSDLLLSDPITSLEQDAIGRTWKYCFYGHIKEIELRIAREKSKAKKRKAEGGGGGIAPSSNTADEILDALEKRHKQFLNEAIALYKYLIDKYTKMLSQSSQASNTAASQNDQDDNADRAIIAILYRMHINLGDLYRYSCSTKLAEECYVKASKLAPATGNPFNQLAVISQSQESLTVVALYYYARSLMATNEPFDKSRTNLFLLLENNRKWLEEHVRNDDPHSRVIASGNVEVDNSVGKRAQREWMMKEKSAINRKFLAKLVDLQWDFMKGVSLDGSDKRLHLNELLSKMSSIIASFSSLLATASFSESLLCKLVATLAFSTLTASNQGKLCSKKGLGAKRDKDPNWNEGVIMTNQAVTFSFVLRFCTALANHLYGHITKRGNKPNASSLGNIRSLTPLLLGSSFISSIYNGSDWFHGLVFYRSEESSGDSRSLENSSICDLCTRSQSEFMESMAKISGQLSEFRKGLPQHFESVSFRDVKEYSEYYGFFPFHSFLTSEGSLDPGGNNDNEPSEYATVEEAMNALSSAKSTKTPKSDDLETRIKVYLLLAISNNISSEMKLPTNEILAGRNEGDALRLPTIDDDCADENEGGVVLKTTYSRSGVPLLVPGNLIHDDITVAEQSASLLNNSHPVNFDSMELGLKTSGFEQSNHMTFQNSYDDALKSMNLSHASDMLQFTDVPAHSDASLREYPLQKIKPLAPPPGFAIPMQPQIDHPRKFPHSHLDTSSNKLSLAAVNSHKKFSSELPVFSQIHQNSYPLSSPAFTTNPFAQSPTTLQNDDSKQHSSVNLESVAWNYNTNRRHNAIGCFDPPFEFNLSTSGFHSNEDTMLSDPSSDDRNNSLLKFLFEADNDGPLQSTSRSQKHFDK
ncbi:hypothetical protein ACHAXS_008318 [Conticribra weissflogii]